MSYVKARESQAREPQVDTSSFLCRVPGCGKRWAVDISHGRVCSFHDELFSRNGATTRPAERRAPASMPTLRAAVRPFIEPERDGEDA